MKWNRKDVLIMLIGIIPAAVALLKYRSLPAQMATHFDLNNQVNGTMSRPAVITMLVLLGLGVPLLMKITRRIDPKSENYNKFEGFFELFRWVMAAFLCLIGLFTVMYNLGYRLNPQLVTCILMGILFLILGNGMGKIRFNYTFGIKTPWTLSDEAVWRRTHRLSGPLWMGAGFVLILGAFLPGSWTMPLVISTITVIVAVPTVYSYFIYRRLKA